MPSGKKPVPNKGGYASKARLEVGWLASRELRQEAQNREMALRKRIQAVGEHQKKTPEFIETLAKKAVELYKKQGFPLNVDHFMVELLREIQANEKMAGLMAARQQESLRGRTSVVDRVASVRAVASRMRNAPNPKERNLFASRASSLFLRAFSGFATEQNEAVRADIRKELIEMGRVFVDVLGEKAIAELDPQVVQGLKSVGWR